MSIFESCIDYYVSVMAKETQCQITHFGAVPDKTDRLSVATECTICLLNLCYKLQHGHLAVYHSRLAQYKIQFDLYPLYEVLVFHFPSIPTKLVHFTMDL